MIKDVITRQLTQLIRRNPFWRATGFVTFGRKRVDHPEAAGSARKGWDFELQKL